MRKIKGVVCIALIGKLEVLFGQNTGRGQDHYETFISNDLTPFSTVDKAKIAQAELQARSDIEEVSLAKIKMNLGENMEEIDSFRAKKNLVVVRHTPEFGEMLLIGRYTQASPSRDPLYGSLLAENGFKTFTSFERAEYTASEENRQSTCPVFMATFKIERL